MTKLITALDVNSVPEAIVLSKSLPNVEWFKVGPILYIEQGPELIKNLKSMGKNIMLDLKFHDIPNTVEKACANAAKQGVDMLTIHLSGGKDMVNAACYGVSRGETKVLGISILTSHDSNSLSDIGMKTNYHPAVEWHVHNLINIGTECEIDGIVCSAKETATVRKMYDENDLIIVNPGIRLAKDAKGDQKRVTTPGDAASAGADFIVMGRSIYNAGVPYEAAQKAIEEISNV